MWTMIFGGGLRLSCTNSADVFGSVHLAPSSAAAELPATVARRRDQSQAARARCCAVSSMPHGAYTPGYTGSYSVRMARSGITLAAKTSAPRNGQATSSMGACCPHPLATASHLASVNPPTRHAVTASGDSHSAGRIRAVR